MGEAPPLGYRAVTALSRFLLRLFYPRLEMIGAEAIPRRGPLIVAANHHNSLVDAMMLVALVPRWLRTLANAPLFRHPLIGPFLKAMGGLPVHRRQEAGNDPSRNQALFDATTAALRKGGAIMLFPEGRTQPEPVLLELRTGAARMLLEAHAKGPLDLPVALLPVGLVFRDPGTFREGEALVLVGEPVDTTEALSLAPAQPEEAARRLTEKLADALREVIVEAGDRETLSLLRLAQDIWADGAARRALPPVEGIAWLKNALAAFRSLEGVRPAEASRLRDALAECARSLEEARLSVSDLSRGPGLSSPSTLVALALSAPLALLGLLAHIVPYKLTGRAVARILKDEEEEATDKIAAGFVFFLLAWATEAAVAYRLAGPGAAVTLLAAVIPLGLITIWWLETANRLAHDRRVRRAFNDGTAARLRERCLHLAEDFGRIASA